MEHSGSGIEQIIGRIHRGGSKPFIVNVEVKDSCERIIKGFDAVIKQMEEDRCVICWDKKGEKRNCGCTALYCHGCLNKIKKCGVCRRDLPKPKRSIEELMDEMVLYLAEIDRLYDRRSYYD